MKIYFAGAVYPYSEIVNKFNQKSLLSFAEKSSILKYFELYENSIFLDSGAFSAYTKKKIIDINEYIDFIKKHKNRLEVYSTLDVIGNYKETESNTKIMEKAGLIPLPTFHFKSPLEELERLLTMYKYIALGGLVPLATHKEVLRKWLDTCFSIIKNKVKVHGFGVNARWAWKRYPFYSVDSTSWLSGSRYRNIIVDRKKITKKQKNLMSMNLHTEHYLKITERNIKGYIDEANFITRLWEKRGVKWN